ncbi:MAG: hypothetical protein HGA78_07840, partial [Nitrospirales bacterium]|nr:hypothetical protein [Nitrospirales bacterium]
FTELLAERYRGRLDEKADSYIEFITSGSRQMSMRINALLTYSSMTMRAKELAPTDCGVVVQEALSDLSLKIKENGTVVTFDPLPTVMADDTQLGLVFLNLISNAIKFRGTEPPRIHISALSIRDFLHINTDLTPALLKHLRDMQRGWVFSVRDNGIGIEPQYHEKIFRIFQRLHTEKEYPGAGTGLAACRKVVEMHGGRIWVKSSAGEGATFFFSLPDTG